MKGTLLYIAILAAALLIIPMITLGFDVPVQTGQVPVHTPGPPSALPQAPPAASQAAPAEAREEEASRRTETAQAVSEGVASFRILDESTGEILTVPLREYVRGAVAAEMPASFHTEALKAQAVAAHTYALRSHLEQRKSPDPALRGADFSADPSGMKVYITEETARAFYGDMADVYWSKICEAADSVLGYILEYEDEPIVAAYHAISAGRTEAAENVWIGSAPYLQAVDSPGDLLAPDYETDEFFTAEEARSLLLAEYPAMDLSGDPENWFGPVEYSDSGYITRAEVGGVELHGKDLRRIFDLRSHNMVISPVAGGFSFTVYGYGHGVGLSQYGADFLARQGCTFDEILKTYYTDAALRRVRL